MPFTNLLQSSGLNIGFTGLLLLLVSVYFSVKHRQIINITKGLLGWGDVLFLLSIAFYLSFLNFIVFYVASLLMVLLLWVIRFILFRKKQEQIPLAGLQAILFVVCLLLDWCCPRMDLTSDYWLIHYLPNG